ncbi:MAG TPA: alpha amylase C-terminal domain-containing protein, partial [Pricia sp.]|nr:alpha amylase C-terminal domain-containing protein [Pricia sp.]
EPGAENAGFGRPSRTSIFDYIGVPHHQRWVNDQKFDGGQLSEAESQLRDFYKRLLNFTLQSDALVGEYQDIHFYNRDHTLWYNYHVLSYVRWSDNEKLIVVSNFDANDRFGFELKLPENIVQKWKLSEGNHQLKDVLYGSEHTLKVKNGRGEVRVDINPLESFILKVQ